MKSLIRLLKMVLADASAKCGIPTTTDHRKMVRRIEREGESFLSITLPAFASEFERALEHGCIGPEDFPGWKRSGGGRKIPAFLGGFLGLVFDEWSGVLLEEVSVDAVLCIRQICLVRKKVFAVSREDRVASAVNNFKEVENEVLCFAEGVGLDLSKDPIYASECHKTISDGAYQDILLHHFERVGGILWSGTLGHVANAIVSGDLIPRHGPGATAERVLGNAKYELHQWHDRLDSHFPFDQYGVPNPSLVGEWEGQVGLNFVSPESERPVRVIPVPKTAKTPRIIAIEPVCMQYTQQALAVATMKSIERGQYTKSRINFRDQGINRDLALSSSVDRKFATIDMREASDRVSVDHVVSMLKSVPDYLGAALACRSTRAELPNGDVLPLKKFASMGSAMCFPMEAMVFFTICVLGRLRHHGLQITSRNVNLMSRDIYVYGDDIIVPTDEVLTICGTLEAFRLKVNPRKTFWKGFFRESCGMDAWCGVDITPVYMRSELPTDRQQVSEVVSSVSFANQLYLKGWWHTARYLRRLVEDLVGPLPTVLVTAPCLGWVTFKEGYDIHGWDDSLQAPRVRSYVVVPKKRKDVIDGLPALMKCLLSAPDELDHIRVLQAQKRSCDHLELSVRSGSVRMKRRWAAPF